MTLLDLVLVGCLLLIIGTLFNALLAAATIAVIAGVCIVCFALAGVWRALTRRRDVV